MTQQRPSVVGDEGDGRGTRTVHGRASEGDVAVAAVAVKGHIAATVVRASGWMIGAARALLKPH